MALYCCNNIVSNTGSTPCALNLSAFTIDNGNIMPGFAALADYTVTNSSSNTTTSSSTGSSSSDRVAIGAGVGVPLGVIALGAIAWAIWERQKSRRLVTTKPQQGGYAPYSNDKPAYILTGGVPPVPLIQGPQSQPQYKAEMSTGETAAAELEGRSS